MAKVIPELSPLDAARFSRKHKLNSETGCWEWSGFRMHKGYGMFWLQDALQRAHRVSYRLHYGVDPEGALVCHSCDNPACVNPSHLWLGDPLSNMRDMISKGRKNGRAARNHICKKCGHDQRLPVVGGAV